MTFIVSLFSDAGILIQDALLRQKRRDEIKQLMREIMPGILEQYGVKFDGWNAPFPSLPGGW